MTYVLTEVALQMLGYRFYDVNGQPHKLNLNQNSRDQKDEEESGPNLDKILFIDLEELKARDVDSETRFEATAATPASTTNTIQLPQDEKVISEVSGQFELIADQIQKISEFVMDGVDPEDRENYEQMQNTFLKQEKASLERELQITGGYRMLFEDAMAEMDTKSLTTYKTLFD